MKKKIFVCVLAVITAVSMGACHKKETKIQTLEYSEIVGAAEGTVDFASEEGPDIKIKDIQSYVGQDIDYSSGIEVKNAEGFEDFQMWVDATAVDIYTVGKYTATYKFIYDGKELEKAVGVTILEKEAEGGSALSGNASSGSNNSSGGNSSSVENSSSAGNSSSGANESGNGGSGNSEQGGVSGGDGQSETVQNTENAGGDNGSGNIPENGNNAGNSSDGGNSGNSGNTPHEIITSSPAATKKPSTIGYTNIELLSGKYVKLKCTSAKYIVSTRTDESEVVKNDKTYHVSKLVITYNTGLEQVLETVETAVN